MSAAETPSHLSTEPKDSASKSSWRQHLSTIAILLLAPILAIFLVTCVFQSYQVDGVSMQNTLQNNDRLIVWKLPRTWARITGHQYVPKRGDIVIVQQDNLSACNQSGKAIIKRVIGLPGERVTYSASHYTVYNAAHPKGFDPDTSLPYGQSGTVLTTDPNGPSLEVTLSKTELFVGGDHRADSCDSRYFGPVQTSTVQGKLIFRLLPFSKAERF